jgi:hypothetical protein
MRSAHYATDLRARYRTATARESVGLNSFDVELSVPVVL